MGECQFCGKTVVSPLRCSFCNRYFCNEHLPPHKHYCMHISTEDIISEIADKAGLSETLLDILAYITRMVIFMTLIAVIVLSFDAVVLLSLSLWDVNTWLTLLWWEGVVMMLFGAAGCWLGGRERPYPFSTPMGKKLYRIKLKVQYPWFWVSLGLAGLVLIIVASLIWQLH